MNGNFDVERVRGLKWNFFACYSFVQILKYKHILVGLLKISFEIFSGVLSQIIAECSPGKKVMDLCILGDKLMQDETGKVFKKEKEMKKGEL